MVYNMAQLDYPVENTLERVWGLWADDLGHATRLSAVLEEVTRAPPAHHGVRALLEVRAALLARRVALLLHAHLATQAAEWWPDPAWGYDPASTR